MKKLITLGVLLLAIVTTYAQSYEAKVEHQRKNHVAAVIELPYSPEVVEDAIKSYMAKKGYKLTSSKGFYTFKGVKLHSNNTDNNDVHFKVERKSRKEKDASLVHMIVSKENESLVQRIADDRAGLEDAKSFLNGMTPHFESHNLEVEIEGQDKSVKKAEKKMESLIEDQADLEKKLKSIQEKLEQNKKDQEAQKVEVVNQKNILEGLKKKRKV
jgi:hypothetical protein